MFTRPSIKEDAKLKLKGNWGAAVLAVLIYELIINVFNFSDHFYDIDKLYNYMNFSYSYGDFPIRQMHESTYGISSFTLAIIVFILGSVFATGLSMFFLDISRGIKVDIPRIFGGFKLFTKSVLVTLLQSLYIFLWMLIPLLLIGVFLAIAAIINRELPSMNSLLVISLVIFPLAVLATIPTIVAAYRYRMVYYILIDNPEMPVSQIIRKSGQIMKGYKRMLFVTDLSFIGWGILCLFTCGIGFLWLKAYAETTYANFYNKISTPETINNQPTDNRYFGSESQDFFETH